MEKRTVNLIYLLPDISRIDDLQRKLNTRYYFTLYTTYLVIC